MKRILQYFRFPKYKPSTEWNASFHDIEKFKKFQHPLKVFYNKNFKRNSFGVDFRYEQLREQFRVNSTLKQSSAI